MENKKAPQSLKGLFNIICDREGIRTPNLLIRSEVLYPVKLRNQFYLKNGVQRYKL